MGVLPTKNGDLVGIQWNSWDLVDFLTQTGDFVGIHGIDSTEQWLRLTALVDDWGMKILLSTMVIDRYRRNHVSIKLSITLLLICRLVGGWKIFYDFPETVGNGKSSQLRLRPSMIFPRGRVGQPPSSRGSLQ